MVWEGHASCMGQLLLELMSNGLCVNAFAEFATYIIYTISCIFSPSASVTEGLFSMEGRRSSAALLFLALALAAGSLGAVAQLHPPAGKRYMLVALQTGRGDNSKLAVRTGDNAIPGFANGKHQWFAVTGNEDLVPPGSKSYRRNIPGRGQGLVNMLGALVNNNGTR